MRKIDEEERNLRILIDKLTESEEEKREKNRLSKLMQQTNRRIKRTLKT